MFGRTSTRRLGATAVCAALASGSLATLGPSARAADQADYVQYNLAPVRVISQDGTSDLDRDGLADVLSVKREYKDVSTDADYALINATVNARRGYDGKKLWSRSGPNLGRVVPMRVGNPPRPGAVFETIDGTGPVYSVRLTAVDGATGSDLWTWSSPPGVGVPLPFRYGLGTEYAFAGPESVVVLPATPGHASNLAVRLATGEDGQDIATGLAISVVSGGDGTSRLACTTGCAGEVTALPDIDRDGYADFNASDGQIEARSSATGAVLWGRTDLQGPRVLADINRDGLSDLIAYTSSGAITLVSGATGATLHSLGTHMSIDPVGDANGDGVPDVIMTDFRNPSYWKTAYSGRTGVKLWQRHIDDPKYVIADAQDVNLDGARETYFETKLNGVTHNYLLNGHDGTLVDGAPLGVPVLAAVDGHGADFVRTTTATSSFTVTAVDGMSRAPLWSFTNPAHRDFAGVYATRMNADKNADVIVVTGSGFSPGSPVKAFVIDGASGKLRWSDG
jgi:hypothetical protein